MVVFPLYWVTLHVQKIQAVPHNLKINSHWKVHKPPTSGTCLSRWSLLMITHCSFMVPNVLIKQEFHQQYVEPQWDAFACEAVPYTHQARPFPPPLLGDMLQGCCILPCCPTCFLPVGDMYHAQWSPPQLSELRPVYLYFMLLFSSHCYGFGFIPTSCKLNQTKLFMLARNYPQLIFRQEIQVLRNWNR